MKIGQSMGVREYAVCPIEFRATQWIMGVYNYRAKRINETVEVLFTPLRKITENVFQGHSFIIIIYYIRILWGWNRTY